MSVGSQGKVDPLGVSVLGGDSQGPWSLHRQHVSVLAVMVVASIWRFWGLEVASVHRTEHWISVWRPPFKPPPLLTGSVARDTGSQWDRS